MASGDAHGDRPALAHDVVREGVRDPPSGSRVVIKGPDHAQQIDQCLVVGDVVLPAPHVACHLLDGIGVENVAQLGGSEEFGEQLGVQAQRGGTAFGQWRISLVEEGRDVAEDQGLREGRRSVGLDIDHANAAVADVAEESAQCGHVEHVLQALTHGLQHDREVREARGDLQQVGGALALLPQGAAPARASTGQEQCAGGALAEATGEECRPADLALDDAGDLGQDPP